MINVSCSIYHLPSRPGNAALLPLLIEAQRCITSDAIMCLFIGPLPASLSSGIPEDVDSQPHYLGWEEMHGVAAAGLFVVAGGFQSSPTVGSIMGSWSYHGRVVVCVGKVLLWIEVSG